MAYPECLVDMRIINRAPLPLSPDKGNTINNGSVAAPGTLDHKGGLMLSCKQHQHCLL